MQVHAEAQALQAALEGAATDRGLDVVVTLNPSAGAAAAAAGTGALIITAPTLEWGATAAGGVDVVWTIRAATHNDADLGAAWDRLEHLMGVVQDVLDLDSATPAAMSNPTGGDPLPAYVITADPTTLT